jgi:hypothetical protein
LWLAGWHMNSFASVRHFIVMMQAGGHAILVKRLGFPPFFIQISDVSLEPS